MKCALDAVRSIKERYSNTVYNTTAMRTPPREVSLTGVIQVSVRKAPHRCVLQMATTLKALFLSGFACKKHEDMDHWLKVMFLLAFSNCIDMEVYSDCL